VSGFEAFLLAFEPGYAETFRNLGLAIVNESVKDNVGLVARFGTPKVIVNHALLVMERRGFINIGRHVGGRIAVHDVLASFRRFLSDASSPD
jgi:molybdate-binding protein